MSVVFGERTLRLQSYRGGHSVVRAAPVALGQHISIQFSVQLPTILR